MNFDFLRSKGDSPEFVKEAFEKTIEGAKTKGKGFSTFVFVTDKQTAACGSGGEILALTATLINSLAEHGIPKEAVLEAVNVAYMSDDELKEKTKEKVEEFKGNLTKLKKELKDLMKELEEGIDNE